MRKLLLLLLIAGCVTQHKAEKYFDKHDQVASDYCTLKYPVKVLPPKVSTRTVHDTTRIPGKTVLVDCDSQKGKVRVKCPDCDSYVDTVYVDSTKTVIDSASLHSMRLKYNAANDKLAASNKSRTIWMWIAIAALGGFLGFKGIFWLIKRIF